MTIRAPFNWNHMACGFDGIRNLQRRRRSETNALQAVAVGDVSFVLRKFLFLPRVWWLPVLTVVDTEMNCPCPVSNHRRVLPCTFHHSHKHIFSITEKSSSYISLKPHEEDPGLPAYSFCQAAKHFLPFFMNRSQLKWGETAWGKMIFFSSNASDSVNFSS